MYFGTRTNLIGVYGSYAFSAPKDLSSGLTGITRIGAQYADIPAWPIGPNGGYYYFGGTDAIERIAIANGATVPGALPETILAGSTATYFIRSWLFDHGLLYFTTCDGPLYRIDPSTKELVSLATGSPCNSDIFVDATNVYRSDPEIKGVIEVPKDGSVPAVQIPGSDGMIGYASDGMNVYGTLNGDIVSLPVGGAAAPTVLVPGGTATYMVYTDGSLFWQTPEDVSGSAVIYRLILGATPPPPVVTPSSCTLIASPSSLPAGGGSVTLTDTCAAGDPATSFKWTGGFADGSTTTGSSVVGSVATTTMFSVIANNAGGESAPARVTVTVATGLPPPQITGLSPASGIGGTPVTIVGVNFGATQGTGAVKFGSTGAVINSPRDWSDTQIKTTAPPGLSGTVPVTVTTLDGESEGMAFNYVLCGRAPRIVFADNSGAFGLYDAEITRKSVQADGSTTATTDISPNALITLPFFGHQGFSLWVSVHSSADSGVTVAPNTADKLGGALASLGVIAPSTHASYNVTFCSAGKAEFSLAFDKTAQTLTAIDLFWSVVPIASSFSPSEILGLSDQFHQIPLMGSALEHYSNAFTLAQGLQPRRAIAEASAAAKDFRALARDKSQMQQLELLLGRYGVKAAAGDLITGAAGVIKSVSDFTVLLLQTGTSGQPIIIDVVGG